MEAQNFVSYLMTAVPSIHKDWVLIDNAEVGRLKNPHATDERSQMRQETCDVKERNEFQIDCKSSFKQPSATCKK